MSLKNKKKVMFSLDILVMELHMYEYDSLSFRVFWVARTNSRILSTCITLHCETCFAACISFLIS